MNEKSIANEKIYHLTINEHDDSNIDLLKFD